MKKKVLTKRENNAVNRIAWMRRAVNVNDGLRQNGFGTLGAVSAIVQKYCPELTHDEVYNFWNFRGFDSIVLNKMEIVLDNLKAE